MVLQHHRQCLADFSTLAGNVAFPPLSGLGVWWSRHWGDESGNKKMVDAVGVMTEGNIQSMVLDGCVVMRLGVSRFLCGFFHEAGLFFAW